MINCSIHNYKEWIGAYMEGSLSREDMLSAEAFLQQHPHLMDQFLEELEEFSLHPEKITTPSFHHLEMNISPTQHIHENNFSEYFISYQEGLLSDIEKTEVNEFLKLNPKLLTEFNVYAHAHLVADISVQFPDKRSLYKKARPAVPLFGSIAAAASILLIIGLFIFWPSSTQQQGTAFNASSGLVVPVLNKSSSDEKIIHDENNSWVKNEVQQNNKKKINIREDNKHMVQTNENITLVNMYINSPVAIHQSSPAIEDVQPEMALRDLKSGSTQIDNNVAEEKPTKKGLFDKIFSGEKTYIEDYVNATFSAFNNKDEDEKWVLRVDRDKDGKSRRVKFSSPLFSTKTKN